MLLAFALQQLNHMLRVEELFKAHLIGSQALQSSTNSEVVPGLEELEKRLFESGRWYARYAEALPLDCLKQFVAVEFVDSKRGSMTREEILFHIINHGSYHRGAIGHALDLAQVARPADTYTVFIHSVEPKRRDQG